MLLCGVGLPLPEELILVAAGYISYRGDLIGDPHHPVGLMVTAAVAIMFGDAIPYVLGRKFGPKLLRLRLVRSWISQEGLARFDRWFQRHGRLTIFVARFLPGIRVPAFFTAGSMGTSVTRFVAMDGLGILISAPLFVWLGWYFGADITTLVEWVQRAEHTVLWGIGISIVLAICIYFFWYRRRRTQKLLGDPVSETTVEPASAGDAETRILAEVGGDPLLASRDKPSGERDRTTHPTPEAGGVGDQKPGETRADAAPGSAAELPTKADDAPQLDADERPSTGDRDGGSPAS